MLWLALAYGRFRSGGSVTPAPPAPFVPPTNPPPPDPPDDGEVPAGALFYGTEPLFYDSARLTYIV